MDDFDFLEDDDQDIEYLDDSDDCVLDQEFIDNHLNIVPSEVLDNFPFVEDDVDAITDYELFSKGFEYLDENKVNKDELSDVAYSGDYDDLSNKPDIPDVSDYVKKDTTELENYPLTSSLSNVAFSGDYDDLIDKPTIPTKTSDLTNDSGYITKNVNDLTYYTKTSDLPSVPTKTSDLTNDSGFITNSVNNLTNYPLTSSLSSVAFSGDYDDLSDKPTIPDVSNFITKDVNDLTYYTLSSNLSSVATSGSYNDLSNKPTIPPSMTILSYGNSTWQDFINAYNSNTIVYCRASSNSNPATGSQTRLGFMAYVNNAINPTEVEFQYYRSVSSHSDSQQGDQVFVYKLTSSGTWSVLSRNTFSKVVAGTNLTSSYSNGSITLNNSINNTNQLTNGAGFITNTVNDLTNYTDTTTLTTLLNNKEDVIEKGSNSNGHYIRLSDGTLIQYGSYINTSLSCTTSYGSFYYGTTSNISFPLTFNNLYTIIPMMKSNGIGSSCINDSSTSKFSMRCINGTSANISITIYWIAIGN